MLIYIKTYELLSFSPGYIVPKRAKIRGGLSVRHFYIEIFLNSLNNSSSACSINYFLFA